MQEEYAMKEYGILDDRQCGALYVEATLSLSFLCLQYSRCFQLSRSHIRRQEWQ